MNIYIHKHVYLDLCPVAKHILKSSLRRPNGMPSYIAVVPVHLWEHHSDPAQAAPLKPQGRPLFCLHHTSHDHCLYCTLCYASLGSVSEVLRLKVRITTTQH